MHPRQTRREGPTIRPAAELSRQDQSQVAGMSARPRKVLGVYYLSPRRIGGAERICGALAEGLAERGLTSVLAFSQQPAPAVSEFFDQCGIEVEVLKTPNRTSLRAHWQFVALLRKHRPETVHLHFIDLLSPYPLLARLAGIRRVILYDHISRPESWAADRASLIKRSIARMAVPVHQVACVSDYNCRCWADSGMVPPARLSRIYNGVDVDACQAVESRTARLFRARCGISWSAFLVAQVSSMIPAKGIETVLEAASIVAESAPNMHFLFAGDGPELDHYRDMADRAGLTGRVTFTGLVADPVGEGLYAAADVVCQASNWNEAFGLTIAEAMASGRPVIGTRAGAIPELVDDGVTGMLVAPRDAPALAEALHMMWQFPERRVAMGQAGLARCRERFSLQVHVEQSLAELDPQD
jgi:glycosyltransferase involved in cell wall biosynthesis